MERAKEFYGDTLGLTLVEENEAGIIYMSGSSKVFIYQSSYAGTNQATYMGWDVNDVHTMLRMLKEKGLTFEKYDIPGAEVERDGEIVVGGGRRSAWFKDSDGNILCIGSKA